MKCVWETDWRTQLECAGVVVSALHERGAAVPRFIASGFFPTLGTWYLVDWLAGTPVEQLTEGLLRDVLAFSDTAADAAPTSRQAACATTWARISAAFSGEAPELSAVDRHSPATRSVADELRLLWAAGSGFEARNADAVHGDFLVTQVLVSDQGRLAGVLDWDNATTGDRGFDLALLFVNVHAQGDRTGKQPNVDVVRTLARRGTEISGPAFGAYLAYHLLKMVGFVVVHNPPHIAWRCDLTHRILAGYRSAVTA
jgi:aminoglycoside phosphotransferase (APT) family kinase protein